MTTSNVTIYLNTQFSELSRRRVIGRRTENCLRSVGIETVGELIEKYSDLTELMKIENFGRKSMDDVQKVMSQVDKSTLTEPELKIEQIDSTTAEYEHLSDIKKKCLEYRFKKFARERLSVRASNGIRRSKIRISEILVWGNDSVVIPNKINNLRNVGKATSKEIEEFSKEIFNIFRDICSISEESAERLVLLEEFDFLLPSEGRKCMEFKDVNGHYPMLYILTKYLNASEINGARIYTMRHGISRTPALTFDEISVQLNLTRERVRQIHNNYLQDRDDPMLKQIVTHNDWSSYDSLLSMLFVTSETSEWKSMKEKEVPGISFSCFAWIIALLGKFKVLEIGNTTLMQNRKYGFDVTKFTNIINDILLDQYDNDKVIDLEKKYGISDETTKEFAREIINILIADRKNVFLKNNRLYIPKNCVDVEKDLCKILRKHKGKMSLDELAEEFNIMNRDIRQLEKEQIRPIIQKSNKISSCGKTGYYGLTEWSNIYYGTIRDLAFKILSESVYPVHVETIYDMVSPHFETTSSSSISNSLENDNAKRFVKFAEGYFGLSDKKYPETFIKSIKKSILYPFDKRMEMYQHFVEEYHHHPFSGRGEDESMLHRWLYNIVNDIINVSQEQKKIFFNMLENYDGQYIPRSSDEFTCYCTCQRYIDYIRENGFLPTDNNGCDLFKWFNKTKEVYHSYDDFRRDYFEELSGYVESI